MRKNNSGESCMTMERLEEPLTRMGFFWWTLDENGDKIINWALREDFEEIDPEDRPDGCTPVVIEITPTNDWVTKKQKEHEFLGDIQDQINKFTGDLQKLQKALKTDG
jgi:hypothetical protein